MAWLGGWSLHVWRSRCWPPEELALFTSIVTILYFLKLKFDFRVHYISHGYWINCPFVVCSQSLWNFVCLFCCLLTPINFVFSCLPRCGTIANRGRSLRRISRRWGQQISSLRQPLVSPAVGGLVRGRLPVFGDKPTLHCIVLCLNHVNTKRLHLISIELSWCPWNCLMAWPQKPALLSRYHALSMCTGVLNYVTSTLYKEKPRVHFKLQGVIHFRLKRSKKT